MWDIMRLWRCELIPSLQAKAQEAAETMADLEVLCSKIQPFQIAMNPKLLEAARLGDRRSLDELLQQYFFSEALGEEIAITISEDAERQNITSFLFGVTPEGNTALHIIASRGYPELVEKICHKERSLLEASNMRLDTPLHHAARAGHHNIVSLIIRFAREGWIEARRVLRAKNMDEANALHEAAKYNHASVATALIEEDVELASMINDVGMSPLYLAIVRGSINVVKALLQSSSWERASPASYAGPDKKTVLHAAVLLSPEIIEAMLKRKLMLAKCADSSGRTPVHYAASDGHHNTVKILLEHDPSTAYLSDSDGLFPIHLAASVGNVSTVDQILQQCPETYELSDREGKNFLHVAFKRRKLDFVNEIISKRPYLRKLLNERDNEGNTPLHTAVQNSDEQSVHFLLRDKTVNINVINHEGFTPLDLCFRKGDKDLHVALDADDYIAICLALTKAQLGTRQSHASKRIKLSGDKVERKSSSATKKKKKEKSSNYETQEMKKDTKICQNFVIVSVLVATVTFAAGFSIPGGYIADDHPSSGAAVLGKEYAFKVFVISDTFAFIFSTAATIWFAFAGAMVVNKHVRRQTYIWALNTLRLAIGSMCIVFGMGIYLSLAPSSKRISTLLCIITLVSPFLVRMVAYCCLSSMGRVAKSVILREGMIQWCWPTVCPLVWKRSVFIAFVSGDPLFTFLPLMLVVAMFYSLAMM